MYTTRIRLRGRVEVAKSGLGVGEPLVLRGRQPGSRQRILTLMRSLCKPLHFDIIITLRQFFRFRFGHLDSMYHAVL